MENTQGDYTLANLNPEEASKNIDDAKLINVSPDAVMQDRSVLSDTINSAKAPVESDPATASLIRSNRSIASIVRPDNNVYRENSQMLNDLGLNVLQTPWDKLKAHHSSNELNAKKGEITGKLFRSPKLSKMDRIRLMQFEEQEQELGKRTGLSSGIGSEDWLSGVVTSIGPTILDSFTAPLREPVAAAIGAAPALGVGATASVAVANPAPLLASAVPAFRTGMLAASAMDTYNRTANDVIYELYKYQQTPEGKNLSHSQMKTIARGVGLAASSIDTFSFGKSISAGRKIAAMFKSREFIKTIVSATLGQGVKETATEQGLRQTLTTLGKAAGMEGGTEVIQSLMQLFGEELGKTVTDKSSETDVLKAFTNIGKTYNSELQYLASNGKLPENSKLRGNITEFTIGVGAGTGTTVGVAGAQTVYQGASNVTKAVIKPLREKRAARKATAPSIAEQTKNEVAARAETRKPIDPTKAKPHSAIQSLALSEAVKTIIDETGKTKLAELQPDTHRQLIAEQFKEAGIDGVWVDPSTMSEWASGDEKKQAFIARKFEGQHKNDIDTNTIFKADPGLIIELTTEFPDAADTLIQPSPQGQTWKQYQDATNEMKARQKALLDKAPRYEDKGLFPDIQTVEQGQARLKELRQGLTELRALPEDQQQGDQIRTRQQEINDLLARIDVLPFEREANGGSQMSFEDRYDRKKNREAQDIVIDPAATDEEIAQTLGDQETAQAYLNRLQRNMVNAMAQEEDPSQIQALRDRVEAILPTLPTDLQGLDVAEENLRNDVPPTSYQAEFMREEPMPAILENALPESERNAINKFYQDAKQSHADAILDGANQELEEVGSVIQEAAMTVERDQIQEELRNDPDVKVVDSFFEGVNVTQEDADKIYGIKKKKATQSVFAVDPDSMTALQREQYLENEKLEQRKFFRKGGLSLDEAASALGVDNGDRLLEIMANKGTTEETVEQIAAQREAEIEKEARESTPLNETSIIKSFDNRQEFHKKLLESFKTDGWGTFKKVLRRVTDTSRSSEMIKREATYATDHTKIKDLNVKKFERGEVQSSRKALNAALNGDLQEAYDQGMNAIHNNETQKAQALAIGKTNRNINKLQKFFSARVQAQLKAAGQEYVDAVNEFLDVLNLSPYGKGQSKQGAYQALANENVKRGLGDARISQDILNQIDNKLPWNEMTVAQLDYVTNSLETLYKQARDKNKAFAEYKAEVQAQTQEMIQDAIALQTTSHPDYDTKRTEKAERASRGDLGPVEKVADFIDSFVSVSVDNIEHTTLQLDRNRPGLFTNLIWNTIAGRGDKKGPYGIDAMMDIKTSIGEAFVKASKQYGSDFKFLGAEEVTVKQFEGNKKLNNGKLRKIDIIMMALHSGNDSNMDTLTNYDVSEETLWEVFDQQLEDRDMQFVQHLWDITSSFEDRVIALEKVDGRDVEIIPPRPFTFKGKQYKGGWFHMEIRDSSRQQKRDRDKYNGKSFTESSDVDTTPFTQGMTKRNFTKSRVGTSGVIDLNPQTIAYTFEMIATDLAMRIPIRETGKILTDKKNKEHIINVIGKNQYKNLMESIYGLTMTPEARGIKNRLETQVFTENVVDKLETASAILSIGFNVTSVLVQPLSLGPAIEAMGGKNGAKHVAKIAATVGTPWNLTQASAFYEFARSIDPSIEKSNRQVDDHYIGGVLPLIPQRKGKKGVVYSNFLKWSQEKSMRPLAITDIQLKSIVAIAAYSQYMAGEAPGTDKQTVLNMAPEDRKAAAREYGQKISSLALTQSSDAHKSQLQKDVLGKRITRYFNDIRQQINVRFAAQRELKWTAKEAAKLAQDGDFFEASQKFDDAGSQVATMLIVTAAMTAYENLIRGKYAGGDDEDEEKDAPGVDLIKSTLISRFVPDLPGVRDVKNALGFGRSTIQLPVLDASKRVLDGTIGLWRMGGFILEDDLSAFESYAKLSKDQKRGVVSIMSLMSGGLPVNGPFKLAQALASEEPKNVEAEKVVIGTIGHFVKTITDFAERFKKSDNDQLKELGENLEEIAKETRYVPEPTMDKSPVINSKGQETYPNGIPNIVLDYIIQAESKGVWDAQNPKSTAFGILQITEGFWMGRRDKKTGKFTPGVYQTAPASLGLTPDGYKMRDGVQARKAVLWSLEQDVKALIKSGHEPTLANIYGLHHFGRGDWLKIINSSPKTSKYDVTSSEVRKANDWLTKREIKQTKDIVKWIDGYIGRAKARVDKKIAKNED